MQWKFMMQEKIRISVYQHFFSFWLFARKLLLAGREAGKRIDEHLH